jgi:GntR family transcriptional regulator, carbon starvation induced regulator
MVKQVNETITGQIFEALKTDVLLGRVAPNERLHADALREKYDVSLSPVREALQRLVATGLVVASERRGFRVAGLTRADLADLGRTRRHIERTAIAEAIRVGDDSWEADVAHAIRALSKVTLVSDGRLLYGAEWETRHREFHLAMVKGSGSPRLIQIWSGLFDQGIRYRRIAQMLDLYHGDSPSEHIEISELVIARDHRALDRIDSHVGVCARLIAEALDDDLLRCAEAIAKKLADQEQPLGIGASRRQNQPSAEAGQFERGSRGAGAGEIT